MDDQEKTGRARGGIARAEALSPEKRTDIARKGAIARWDRQKDVPQAAYTGELKIGDMIFPCSVLSDGTRILTQSDFMSGMGMYYSGWVARQQSEEKSSAEVPHFLAFKSLEPFVHKYLGDLQSITLKYRTERGNIAHGIRAEIIPKICEIWLDAEDTGKLGSRQKTIAQKARLLIRALAHVGIIALVDEATGYQEIRDQKALQTILDRYLRKELAAWAKRFPDEFYKQMFRLRRWEWLSISGKRPAIVGKFTNDLVYERLATGILQELEARNPKDDQGKRRGKHHQLLTDDVGHPALAQHLHAVTGFMRASSTWDQFYRMMNRAFPKKGETIQLAFDD